VSGKYKEITPEDIHSFRNLGGFHYLGSGRTKIETDEQLKASVDTCVKLQLDGLVVIGGDDSNTNAGILAEYFLANKCSTCVVGVPKTIDGDMRNEDIEASFGFDTACRVYAASAANLCFDAISALKSYHFVRVMGRDASHITLEVSLQVHPNLSFISEEVGHSKVVRQQA
jgi:pyrophosphate--fructose-6-phosphate 1-phosphotransferase